jgi:lysozyme
MNRIACTRVTLVVLLLAALTGCNRPATQAGDATPTSLQVRTATLPAATVTTEPTADVAIATAVPQPTTNLPKPTVVQMTATTAPPSPVPAEVTPEPEPEPTETPIVESTAEASAVYVYHTVQPGENLFRIGLLYGLSWELLLQVNGLANADSIYAGQVLLIPSEVEEDKLPSEQTIHIVQLGENLFRIGLQYGLSWETIARANGISDPNAIYAGMQLVIPAVE